MLAGIEHPDLRAALLMGPEIAGMHQHIQLSACLVVRSQLIAAGPPGKFLYTGARRGIPRSLLDRPGLFHGGFGTQLRGVHKAGVGKKNRPAGVTVDKAVFEYWILVGVEERLRMGDLC